MYRGSKTTKKYVVFIPIKSLNENFEPFEKELRHLGFEDENQDIIDTLIVVHATPHTIPFPLF